MSVQRRHWVRWGSHKLAIGRIDVARPKPERCHCCICRIRRFEPSGSHVILLFQPSPPPRMDGCLPAGQDSATIRPNNLYSPRTSQHASALFFRCRRRCSLRLHHRRHNQIGPCWPSLMPWPGPQSTNPIAKLGGHARRSAAMGVNARRNPRRPPVWQAEPATIAFSAGPSTD
jgi:hypothetical protein